ncbi:MAG TPA: DUF4129 domain-containing protein [Mycobacteriales bacterium]|nr:DUF4129 domain-containing protein [Mycobacteriales bacterium]
MQRSVRSRRAAVALLAAGLAGAALATGSGPYLRADQEFVGRPFRISRLFGDGFGGGSGREVPASLRRAADVFEAVLVLLVSLVLVVLVAAVLTVFVRGLTRIRLLRLRRAAAADVPDTHDGGELADDEGLTPLRRRLREQLAIGEESLATGEPAEVIVACYLAMLDAIAAHGVARRAHETPTELLDRVLAEYDVPPAALATLTDLYREARYSRHRIDAGMRTDARAALAAIRDALGGVRR